MYKNIWNVKMSKKLKIPVGYHILGIFHEENILEYALNFLRWGFEEQESVMLITNHLPKDQIRVKINEGWKLNDLENFETNNRIILKNPQEIFFPNGSFILTRSSSIWKNWTNFVLKNGSKGLRIFFDTSILIKKGFEKQVFELDSSIDNEFDSRCKLLCAYTNDDMKSLGKVNYSQLKNYHDSLWLGE